MLETQEQRREAMYLALAQVPEGRVITYGNLAKLAGMPNGARLAGKVMCSLPANSRLPWHRVINAQGRLSLPEDSDSYREQIRRLRKEGVEFHKGKIKLSLYAYSF